MAGCGGARQILRGQWATPRDPLGPFQTLLITVYGMKIVFKFKKKKCVWFDTCSSVFFVLLESSFVTLYMHIFYLFFLEHKYKSDFLPPQIKEEN